MKKRTLRALNRIFESKYKLNQTSGRPSWMLRGGGEGLLSCLAGLLNKTT